MSDDEVFESFRSLQGELSRRGMESEAIRLEAVMVRRGSGGDWPRLASEWLAWLRASNPAPCARVLAPALGRCIAALAAVGVDCG